MFRPAVILPEQYRRTNPRLLVPSEAVIRTASVHG